MKVGFEFLRVLEGKLEDIVEEFNPVLPVLLDGVVLIHFLELAVVGGEVFASHYFIEDYLLKLVVLNLDP